MEQPAIGSKKLSKSAVVIVGSGLMGGSLALALKPYVAQLHAVDTNPETIRLAKSMELIDHCTSNLAKGISSADLIILGTPVGKILEIIRQLPSLSAGWLHHSRSRKHKKANLPGDGPPTIQFCRNRWTSDVWKGEKRSLSRISRSIPRSDVPSLPKRSDNFHSRDSDLGSYSSDRSQGHVPFSRAA